MPDIAGNYEGEGVNVAAGGQNKAVIPDVSTVGNKGTTGMTPIDRRRRLRVSSECARAGVAISYGGGDQVLAQCARAVYITTGGTLVLRMQEDTADLTFTGLILGQVYPFAIALIRQGGSTAAGILLF